MTPYTATGSATAGIGHLLAENTDLSSLIYLFNAILVVNIYNDISGTYNPPHAAFLGYKWVKDNATHANGSIVNQYVIWQLLALEQENMRCFTVKLWDGVKESDCSLPMRGICNCTGDRARIEVLKQGEIFYMFFLLRLQLGLKGKHNSRFILHNTSYNTLFQLHVNLF